MLSLLQTKNKQFILNQKGEKNQKKEKEEGGTIELVSSRHLNLAQI